MRHKVCVKAVWGPGAPKVLAEAGLEGRPEGAARVALELRPGPTHLGLNSYKLFSRPQTPQPLCFQLPHLQSEDGEGVHP